MLQTCIADAQVRRGIIAAALASAPRDHWVTLKQGPLQIAKAPLPHDVLIYRVDNGRLLAELLERLGTDPRQLLELQEHEAAASTQTLLHELLLSKARDPRGPILEELQRLAVQTEPLLVDAEGVVVNGNRRLAAMRWLLEQDSERFTQFRQPLVAVLPADVARADLEFIEAALQMAPETKLAYGWIDRRLKLREQRDQLGMADAWIQEAYRMADPDQLERELAELKLAEAYLAQVLATPHHYSAIADAEELFIALQAQLSRLSPRLQRTWRPLGWLLISQRHQLDGSLARQFPFADPVGPAMAELVLERLAQDWGLLAAAPKPDGTADAPTKLLRGPVLRQLADKARLPQQRDQTAQQIQNQIDAVRLELRQDLAPEKVLQHLRKTRRLLGQMRADQLGSGERQRLAGELAALRAQADLLLGPAVEGLPAPATGTGRLKRLLRRLRGQGPT